MPAFESWERFDPAKGIDFRILLFKASSSGEKLYNVVWNRCDWPFGNFLFLPAKSSLTTLTIFVENNSTLFNLNCIPQNSLEYHMKPNILVRHQQHSKHQRKIFWKDVEKNWWNVEVEWEWDGLYWWDWSKCSSAAETDLQITNQLLTTSQISLGQISNRYLTSWHHTNIWPPDWWQYWPGNV